MRNFAVTRDRYNTQSIANGDTTSSGYVRKRCTLREALRLCDDYGLPFCTPDQRPEPDSSHGAVRWLSFTTHLTGTDCTGRDCYESRALHFPRSITAASSRRLTRLICGST